MCEGVSSRGRVLATQSGLAVSVRCLCLSEAGTGNQMEGRIPEAVGSCNGVCPVGDAEFAGKPRPTCVAEAPILELVLSPECDYGR